MLWSKQGYTKYCHCDIRACLVHLTFSCGWSRQDCLWCSGGATAVKDKGRAEERKVVVEEPESTYYDAMKQEMAERAARTKSALDALDPHQRIAMEGFRPGTYLRLRFKGNFPILANLFCESSRFKNSIAVMEFYGFGFLGHDWDLGLKNLVINSAQGPFLESLVNNLKAKEFIQACGKEFQALADISHQQIFACRVALWAGTTFHTRKSIAHWRLV